MWLYMFTPIRRLPDKILLETCILDASLYWYTYYEILFVCQCGIYIVQLKALSKEKLELNLKCQVAKIVTSCHVYTCIVVILGRTSRYFLNFKQWIHCLMVWCFTWNREWAFCLSFFPTNGTFHTEVSMISLLLFLIEKKMVWTRKQIR